MKKDEKGIQNNCPAELTECIGVLVQSLCSLLSNTTSHIRKQISSLCKNTAILRKHLKAGRCLPFVLSSPAAEYVSSFIFLSLLIFS